jgi:hypothetical protein
MKRWIMVAALLVTAACGGTGDETVSAPTSTPTVTPTPIPPTTSGVHFDTPEAAMRYLATAWNNDDIVSLKHVTDPAARELLLGMKHEATNLKLTKCTFDKQQRDYQCLFSHDFPPGFKHKNPLGAASFRVGPADKPGWYMTVYEYCGDAAPTEDEA